MIDPLQQAVARATKVFYRDRFVVPLGYCVACDGCLNPADEGRILEMAPSAMTVEDYRLLSEAVILDMPAENAKALLPRALKFIAAAKDIHSFRSASLPFLEEHEWRAWQPDEVEAIELFCRALFDDFTRSGARLRAGGYIHDGDYYERIDVGVQTFLSIGWDCVPALEESFARGGFDRLATLVWMADSIEDGRFKDEFLQGDKEQKKSFTGRVFRLATSPETIARIDESLAASGLGDDLIEDYRSLREYLANGAKGNWV